MSTIHTKMMNRNTVWTSAARSSKSPSYLGARRRTRTVAAFTLVELLTVIAIIAILGGIIFAAFAGAREKGRQTASISNMREIQNGVERYKLDHRGQYPPVLFAYSDGTSSMANIKNAGSAYLKGLYPQYINDPSVFLDPNSDIKDPARTDFQPLTVNQLDPSGALQQVPGVKFFKGDAYDIGPHMSSATDVDQPIQYVVRYQTAWTSTPMPATLSVPPPSTPAAEFARQLDQQNSTDDTYLTMTTYHVHGYQKVLLIFKGGNTKTFDASRLLSPGCAPDTTDISETNGVANAKFWMVKPTGACP